MRIGLFLNNLDGEYQISIYRGVRAEAAGMGLDLVSIQGESLNYYRNENPEKLFPSREFIGADGLLLLTSTIMDLTVGSPISAFWQHINVPIVSVGSRLPDYPSIIVRNRKSMTQLMDHLILHHGYRKLLFLGGPVEHPANLVREHIFVRTINTLKAEYPGLQGRVINGDFYQPTAMMMMKEYIDACPDDPPDVIVSANDVIALAAQGLLHTIDDPRWHNCPVTGFDDIEQAKMEVPALTTVWQPLEELGRLAVWTLWDMMTGKEVSPVIYAESELRIRSSCGCTESADHGESKIADKNPGGVIGNLSEYHLQNVNFIGQAFIAINSMGEMLPPLSFFLTNLAVKTFYLILYPTPLDCPGKSGNLIYYRNAEKDYFLTDNPETVEMTEFFTRIIENPLKNNPDTNALSSGTALSVFYLCSGSEYLGLIVYDAPDYVLPQICNAAIFLSNTVKRLEIHAGEREQAQRLEKEVAVRTKDLGKAYEKLQEEVRRRITVEAEVLKISEMERLRFSMDLHDDICQRLAGISMFCKSFIQGEKPNSFLPELSELIDETLARTRRYAHDSFPMELDVLGLKETLDALCHTVTRQNTCRCIFSWSAPGKSPFNSAQDLNVYRIVQEALHNAVKHANATIIYVEVNTADGFFTVSISDNGTGDSHLNEEISDTTDLKRFVKRGGLGLRSMHYRAHQLEAEYIFESTEQDGTKIVLKIPLPKPFHMEK